MANNRQIVIHYHTSGTTNPQLENVRFGEIGVRHNTNRPELIIKKDENTFATFIDELAISGKIATLKTTLEGEIDSLSGAVDTKFKSYYTKTEADAEFMTQTEVDDRINALIVGADPEGGKTIENIQNLVKYVDENAGEIASLITTVGNHTTAIEKNASDISKINSDIAALIQPKASSEISVATDGTLGIIEVNVNKLVQTEGEEFIINGGNA